MIAIVDNGESHSDWSVSFIEVADEAEAALLVEILVAQGNSSTYLAGVADRVEWRKGRAGRAADDLKWRDPDPLMERLERVPTAWLRGLAGVRPHWAAKVGPELRRRGEVPPEVRCGTCWRQGLRGEKQFSGCPELWAGRRPVEVSGCGNWSVSREADPIA